MPQSARANFFNRRLKSSRLFVSSALRANWSINWAILIIIKNDDVENDIHLEFKVLASLDGRLLEDCALHNMLACCLGLLGAGAVDDESFQSQSLLKEVSSNTLLCNTGNPLLDNETHCCCRNSSDEQGTGIIHAVVRMMDIFLT